MKFKYLEFPFHSASPVFNKVVKRPIIPITISEGKTAVEYDALIDSGADFCIFDSGIAEYLGIDVDSGIKVEFGGVQDQYGVAYFHKVKLAIGNIKAGILVGFSSDMPEHAYGILGQKGFFDRFEVSLSYQKDLIQVSHTPPGKNAG